MSDEFQFEAAQTLDASTPDLARLAEVPVELAVEIGRTTMTIGETLGLGPGSIVSLNRLAGEPLDLLVNGRPIARGEVVVIDEEFGLRLTEVVAPARRLGDGDGDGFEASPAAGFETPAIAEVVMEPEAEIAELAVEETEATVADDAVVEAPDEPVDAVLESAEPEPVPEA